MPTPDALKAYREKRNFSITSEPAEGGAENPEARSFVVQKHWASRLHYDFRLELDGSMRSWAVPKGPSYDPHDKRMAVQVEDHPISYNTFEGEIPPDQYGAGKVIIWDKGVWAPVGDPHDGYREGNLKFILHGHKLQGKWALIRMKGRGEKQIPWLLIKERDELARPSTEFSVVDEMPDSVSASNAVPAVKGKAAVKAAGMTNPTTAVKEGAAVTAEVTSKTTAKAKPATRTKKPAKVALPTTLAPELATLVEVAPTGDDWAYEIKFDGYRMLARIEGAKIQLITRNGNDWSARLPGLIKALAKLKIKSGWLDGEIVVPNAQGLPDFQALQGAFDSSSTGEIVYYLFDLPFHEGVDLRSEPLETRREALRALFDDDIPAVLRFSETLEGAPAAMLVSACNMGMEGLIGKRIGSTYQSRRSAEWIKLKCNRRQEFVIGGYTDPQGTRSGIGSLLLGVHDEHGKLQYAGNVGTGFSEKTLSDLKRRLTAVAASERPFAGSTGLEKKARWVKPELLAEVSFAEWTGSGRVRHAVFHGLRSDKTPHEIVREAPQHAKPVVRSILPSHLKLTHPERVVDALSKTTKLDLVRYYALVGPLMMPYLKDRPTSLVRAPEGVGGELFFQKHGEPSKLRGVRALPQELDPGHEPLMEIASPEGLLSSAQMNVIEFHTWNARKGSIARPDRMTFDLDPGEGVGWPQIQEAAEVMRAFLAELGLKAYLKTSGGKGLHVVVPLKKLYGWDPVKDFSRAIVEHIAKTLPTHFSAKSGAKNRVGKVFIDYLRNGFGATTVAAWSVRARPGMGISVPVAWDELPTLKSGAHWTIATIHTRLERGNAPWDDYAASAQNLTPAMRRLGFKPQKA